MQQTPQSGEAVSDNKYYLSLGLMSLVIRYHGRKLAREVSGTEVQAFL